MTPRSPRGPGLSQGDTHSWLQRDLGWVTERGLIPPGPDLLLCQKTQRSRRPTRRPQAAVSDVLYEEGANLPLNGPGIAHEVCPHLCMALPPGSESSCFRRTEREVLPRSLLRSWAVARFSYESNEFNHRRRCWELKKSKRFCTSRTQTGPAANESWSCWLVTYQRNNSISHWKCVNALTFLTSHFSHLLLVNSQNCLDLLWKQASVSNPG